jgi:hypothetical protein
VGHEEHRLARALAAARLAPHPQQLDVHLVAGHRVEGAEGLVHQEQGRIEQKSAAERGPLLHATRQLAR